MASNNNYLELLINLGVSDNSRDNIEQYIKTLKNLPKVKIELEADGLSSTNKGFSETNKIIEDLQEQVKQLKSELKGLGSTKLGINGLEDFKKEIGKSIKSIGDLEQVAKKFNGDMTLNYKTVTKIDPVTNEEYKDNILKSINATMQDVDGRIKTLTFTPVFNEKDVLTGIDQVSEKIKNVDFKDFDKKFSTVEERMRQLGRQGYISADQMDKLYDKLDNANANKSVSALESLNRELTELSNKDTHTNKLANAMSNIENQSSSMVRQLEKLNNIDGLDKLGLEKVINELNKLSNTPIQTDAELKEVNAEFKNAERSAKEFIKEAHRISKVNGEIEKLQTTIANLKSQGSLSSKQTDKFLLDVNSVEKTTEAVKRLENQINQTANSTTSTKKIENAMNGISPTVDRLNEKLDIMVNKLGANVDTSRLEKIRNEIQQIGNTKLTTIDDIAKLNAQLSQTEKSITQLGVASNAMSAYEKSVKKVNNALEDLEQTGYSTADRINEFKNTLNNIPTGDLSKVNDLLEDIERDMKSIARENSIRDALQGISNKMAKLDAQYTRTITLNRRTFDKTQAEAFTAQMSALEKQLKDLPDDIKLIKGAHLDEINKGLDQAQISMQNFVATTRRGSDSILNSLKTAFEKFPVK